MELAFQHVSKRGSLEDVRDIVLLDTETGHRRRIVERVFWGTPRWTDAGRRIRYTQKLAHKVFVSREIDVETGTVRDVTSEPPPDGSLYPGFSDDGVVSPAGRWIVYRNHHLTLCVARVDGSEAFALHLGLEYTAARVHWCASGTEIAVSLTAGFDSGAYVIDLRTGEARRVSPALDPERRDSPNYHVSGWSPDGTWIVATRNRWHNAKTYDFELNDICLLSPDGTTHTLLTDDGLSARAAIRPTGEAPLVSAEHELTFAWATPLRSPGDRSTAGDVLAAQVRVDLDAGPPFAIVLMVRTAGGVVYPTIPDCRNIPDGFTKLDAFLEQNNYRPADSFTVVFPRYATDDPDEDRKVLRIAHLILAETRTRSWRFGREVPPAPVD